MGNAVTRLPDWQSRLTETIRQAKATQFDPKRWNCALFAAACAEAITGRSMPRKLKGALDETVDSVFSRVAPALAQRGDVVLAHAPEPSLGVCCGRVAAFVTASSGLTYFPMQKVRIAWRV